VLAAKKENGNKENGEEKDRQKRGWFFPSKTMIAFKAGDMVLATDAKDVASKEVIIMYKYRLAIRYQQILFALIAIFITSVVLADPDINVKVDERPRIGLVLSGGGARGAAHVGVLKVLEKLRIPIDIVTGTSMGAVIGGLYAYGYSPAKLEEKLVTTDWGNLFQDNPLRAQRSMRRKHDDYNYLIKLEAGFKNGAVKLPTGLIQGQKLDLMLRSLMPDAPEDFDKLPVPFRALAEDIETGEAVAMGRGDIVSAMRASMSIPGVFAPVARDGRLLVDGGFANNLPVRLARKMGADILIVVDLGSPRLKRDRLVSPLSILNQNMGFMIQRNTRKQLDALDDKDILIRPNLAAYSSTDFWRVAEMIKQGVAAAKLHTTRLMKLSLSKNAYRAHLKRCRSKRPHPRVIDSIVISNDSKLSSQVIRSYITVQPGEVLDIATLERDLQKLYGLNIFERVSYKVTQRGNKTILNIDVKKKSWGPNYIRFGLNLESNFEGSSRYNLASSITSTPLNSLGGEWRTELQVGSDQYMSTEFYQPLDENQNYFASTKATYSELHFARYQNGEQLSDYKIASSRINVAVGRDFANRLQLQVGLIKGKGDMNLLIGSRPAPEQNFHVGARYFNLSYDRLDDINFPKHGALGSVQWVNSRTNLGADANQDSLAINALWAGTWGRNTFMLWTGIAGVVNSDVAAADTFALGGFLNLSGYRKQELTGRYVGIARLIYLNKIGGDESFFNIPFYVGGSLETGNTWNDKNNINTTSLITAGSLVISFDTPVGPLYLAKGFANGGKSENYLFLGRSFTFF